MRKPSPPSDFRNAPRVSVALVASCFAVLGLGACRGDEAEKVTLSRSTTKAALIRKAAGTDAGAGKKVEKKVDPKVATSAPFTNEEAMRYLTTACAGCHDKGKPYQSFWGFDSEKITPESFAVDALAYRVYQVIKLRGQGAKQGPPAPMPPEDESEATKLSSLRFAAWVEKSAPDVMLEAHANYPDSSGVANLKVLFNFTCKAPVSFRQYLRRVTNDAFDREPSASELAWAGDSPDVPTTKALRDLVSAKFETNGAWQQDFNLISLRKFANKIVGVNDIQPSAEVPIAMVNDLRNEFYQLMLAGADSMSWKEMLLTDKVMVTSLTAPLYAGCTAPPPGVWGECTQQAPRGSFFTTVGALLSKRTSFLEVNNNYGRSALMSLTVTGELLAAATNGPKGTSGIKPLPECLKTRDYRGTVAGDAVAPFGSAKVPSFGNVCQSCHISRNMAAGSILFRPFTSSGLIFDPAALTPMNPEVVAATAADLVTQGPDGVRAPVTIAFLQELLSGAGTTEKACIAPTASAPERPVATVKELAESVASSNRVVAKGLSRHIPRAFSNAQAITLELQDRMVEAYEKGGGRLRPMIQSYFSSETFACEQRN